MNYWYIKEKTKLKFQNNLNKKHYEDRNSETREKYYPYYGLVQRLTKVNLIKCRI